VKIFNLREKLKNALGGKGYWKRRATRPTSTACAEGGEGGVTLTKGETAGAYPSTEWNPLPTTNGTVFRNSEVK